MTIALYRYTSILSSWQTAALHSDNMQILWNLWHEDHSYSKGFSTI